MERDLPRKLRLLQEGVASEAADYIEELHDSIEKLYDYLDSLPIDIEEVLGD